MFISGLVVRSITVQRAYKYVISALSLRCLLIYCSFTSASPVVQWNHLHSEGLGILECMGSNPGYGLIGASTRGDGYQVE